MSNVSRLPGPSAEVWDWQRNGACRGATALNSFTPTANAGLPTRREIAAKAVCRTCPVRAECAAHALAAREPYGVWGGFTEAERLRLLVTGWEDLSDHVRGRVDILRLEARLGLGPAPPPSPAPATPASRFRRGRNASRSRHTYRR